MLLIVSMFACNILNAAAMDYEPCFLAIQFNKTDVVRDFLQRDKNIIHYKHKSKNTPLSFAVMCGRTELVGLFLDAGADIEAKDSDDDNDAGWTLLQSASFCGYIGVVRLLLERGANTKTEDKYGQTAAMIAQIRGNHDIAQLISSWPKEEDIKESEGD